MTRSVKSPLPEKLDTAKNPAAPAINPEERRRMIAEAAYYRAEHRGFTGGDPVEDWCLATAEIDAMLSQPQPARMRAVRH